MKSSAVEYGLRKAGSGGARRDSGRKRALPDEYDIIIIGGECEGLLRQHRIRLADEARQRILDAIGYNENLIDILTLPILQRADLIDLDRQGANPDEVQHLMVERIPNGLSEEEGTDAHQAVEHFVSALENLAANRRGVAGIKRIKPERRSPDGQPERGLAFPGELPIPKVEMKAVRRRIVREVLYRYTATYPHLTPRAIEEAWRYLNRMRRELYK